MYFVDSKTCLDAYNKMKQKTGKFNKFEHYICAAQV